MFVSLDSIFCCNSGGKKILKIKIHKVVWLKREECLSLNGNSMKGVILMKNLMKNSMKNLIKKGLNSNEESI